MQTVEILKAGRALIENPAHWAKGRFAFDCHMEEVTPGSPDACSWCSVGALIKLVNYEDRFESRQHLEQAIRQIHSELPAYQGTLEYFNDTHTHSEVLRVWDKAIENASNS